MAMDSHVMATEIKKKKPHSIIHTQLMVTLFYIQWGMLQQTACINKIRMLQRTQILQQTWRNNKGRRSTRVRMTCRAFLL
jgi:hypothetical protein